MDFDSLPKIRSLPQSATTRPHKLPKKLFIPLNMIGRLTRCRLKQAFSFIGRPRSVSSQIIIRGIVMSSTKTDLPQEVASPIESGEPSSPDTRRKFDTRSEL